MRVTNFSEIIENYDYFIFDSDGTLLEMEHPIGDSMKILEEIRKQGKKFYVLSNNSKRSLEDIVERYMKNKIKIIAGQEVLTSAYVTCLYLKSFPEIKNIYFIGSLPFKNMLEAEGFNIVHWGEDREIPMTVTNFLNYSNKPTDVDAVVTGGDNEFNYFKIVYASLCIQNGAKFVASDDDPTFMFQGIPLPSAAYTSHPISKLTGVEAKVIGKPSAFALDIIMKRDGIPLEKKNRMIMIGDSLNTDILVGINGGIDTMLTLTGVCKEKDIEDSSFKPKYIIDKLIL